MPDRLDAFHDSERILRQAATTFFDHLSEMCEGIMMVDRSGRLVWISDRYERYLNALGFSSPAEVLGRPVEEVVPNTLMREVVETGRPILLDIIENHSGSFVVSRFPLHDDDGTVIGAVGLILYDRIESLKPLMTRLNRLQSELAQARKELAQQRRTRYTFSNFVGNSVPVATAFQTLASQLSEFTGGEDGLSFRLPAVLQPSFSFADEPFLGVDLDGRFLSYYLLFFTVLVLFLLLLRVVNSPFGRVLQAIRENDFRAEALGYRTVVYRTISSVLSALFATMAGALLAIWLRYNGPDTSLSFEIMIDILLIVVIGGMGTLYGAVIGSALFVVAQNYLQDLMALASGATESIPVLSVLLSPDRWLLWLGVLFVLSVYYFPTGIVGRLRLAAYQRRLGKP